MAENVITEKLKEDLKTAMKDRDKLRVSTLRMLLSEMKNAQLEARGGLSGDQELSVLTSYAKKRRESIKGYEQGGRDYLAESEKNELEIVMAYLPEQMGEEEIRAEIVRIIGETGASGPKDMGKVMGQMMARFKGKADGNAVKSIAMEELRGGKT